MSKWSPESPSSNPPPPSSGQPVAPARWSDRTLAERLRAKRRGLGVPDEVDARVKVRHALRTITRFLMAPWDTGRVPVDHPWRSVWSQIPSVKSHRTIGAHAIDFLGPDLPPRQNSGYVLDGIEYERAAATMRSEQHLNEACWFLDGKLAIAWNVVKHRALIAYWQQHRDESGALSVVEDRADGLVRVHPGSGLDFRAAPVAHVRQAGESYRENTLNDDGDLDLEYASVVQCGAPQTVWGALSARPSGSPLIEKLNAAHRFEVLV